MMTVTSFSKGIVWIRIICCVILAKVSGRDALLSSLSNHSTVSTGSLTVSNLIATLTKTQDDSIISKTLDIEMESQLTTKSYTHHIRTKYQCLSDIEQYLNLPDNNPTKQYILKFSDKYQREMIATQLSYCPYTPLCNYSLYTIANYECCGKCSCDSSCWEYNSCCPDVTSIHTNSKFKNKINYCIPLQYKGSKAVNSRSVYGVKHCPLGANSIDIAKCEQWYTQDDVELNDMIPVVHRNTNIVYRNMHCAFCNGISDTTVDFFEPRFECNEYERDHIVDLDPIQFIKSSPHCTITFEYRGASFLRYCTGRISSCNVTGKWVHYDAFYENACKSYTSLIDLTAGVFQNVNCAICNGVSNIRLQCTGAIEKFMSKSRPYGFSGLLSFTPITSHDVIQSASKRCGAKRLYDRVMDMCVPVRCSPFRQLVNGKCKTAIRQVSQRQYELYMRLKPSALYSLIETEESFKIFITKLHSVLQDQLLNISSVNIDICKLQVILSINGACSANNLTMNISLSGNKLTDLLVKMIFIIRNNHNPEILYDKISQTSYFSIYNVTGEIQYVFNMTILNGFDRDFVYGFDHFHSSIGFSKGGSVRFCSNVTNTISIPLKEPTLTCLLMHDESIPVASLLPCVLVEINSSIYPWVLTKDGAEFTNGHVMINHKQLYIHKKNETLYLCKDKYNLLSLISTKAGKEINYELIASIVCVSLSLVALVLTLLIYVLFKFLQTPPGKNVMSLTTSLLVAQSTYLIGSFSRFETNSAICLTIGILTHFSFLYTMFWMNICTFHMFSVLTKIRQVTQTSGNKRFIIYHLYSFCMSCLFVIINIIVSSTISESTNIGYGEEMCYISDRFMVLFTFAVPLLLIIISNIAMFIHVVVTIKTISYIQDDASRERNDIAIFVRLSTLTGITWIFGLIYTWSKIYAFSILFMIFSAGQGVFIFISFVCNRRVKMVIRERVSYLQQSTQASSV